MAITIVDWPSGLPETLHVQGYSEEGPDLLLRSEMGNGIAKQRPKATQGVEPVSGTMIVTTAEKATLKTFLRDTVRYGGVAIRWDLRGGGDEIVRLTGPESYEALGGGQWRVSFELEVMP